MSPTTAPWWRSAVIYQVYIRSFADGNGDGVGDITGIRSRLPYLESLGGRVGSIGLSGRKRTRVRTGRAVHTGHWALGTGH